MRLERTVLVSIELQMSMGCIDLAIFTYHFQKPLVMSKQSIITNKQLETQSMFYAVGNDDDDYEVFVLTTIS